MEKWTLIQVFFCKFCESFKSTYFEEHLQTAASEMRKRHRMEIFESSP